MSVPNSSAKPRLWRSFSTLAALPVRKVHSEPLLYWEDQLFSAGLELLEARRRADLATRRDRK
jgi:hypothetical protein